VVRAPDASFSPDLEFELRASAATAQILRGEATTVWSYTGKVLKGEAANLQAIPGSYLGPLIRARTGQRVRVTFTNDLPEDTQETIIHWHGLVLPEDMDGHPRFAVQPKQTYVYEFEVTNRAGTYWFHPHPHRKTGRQVQMGLAGLFLVSDEEEQALALPRDNYDVPLVIQDRTFDAGNQFAYLNGGGGMIGGMDHSGMMAQMMGFLGQRVLINGQPDYTLSVATRVYRLRLLNGSNARIYKLGWSTGQPLIVIGTDGGLLEKPVEKPYVMLAPGERVELWADFSGFEVGAEIALNSLEYSGPEDPGGMMGMMSGGPSLGAPLTLLRVKVERAEAETLSLPQTLTRLERLDPASAVNASQPRPVALSLRNMIWLINGKQFEMRGVTPEETVKANTLEVWEIVNELNPGEMMDVNGMAHPIHLHGVQFQVVGREVLPELKAGWDTVSAGYVDEGWKDTVLVMPGERVKIAMRFSAHTGLFIYHCHNLEHEDQGMMRNYRITV
jgi:FtsP/CotA-like multicopper oxidase with cupredoxin domain